MILSIFVILYVGFIIVSLYEVVKEENKSNKTKVVKIETNTEWEAAMKKLILLMVCLLGITGCQAGQGPQGEQGVAGTAGNNGANGTAGQSCKTEQTLYGSLITCEDGTVSSVYNGESGKSCVVQQESTGAKIVCQGSEAFISNGLDGQQGEVGATGQQGVQGATGETGATGATGAVGETGQTGATGQTGETGAVGATGTQGTTGETGQQGVAGQDGKDGTDAVCSSVATSGGVLIVCNDGSSTFLANGKDGVNGKDGKDGTKVEIIDLCGNSYRYGEILMRIDGDYLVGCYTDINAGKIHLVNVINGSWVTTDGFSCYFNVNNGKVTY